VLRNSSGPAGRKSQWDRVLIVYIDLLRNRDDLDRRRALLQAAMVA
jgi:hypothetical protein